MKYDILVTGGAGYLGSVLVPELLSQGHKVTVLDNFMYSQSSLAECCRNKAFSVVRGDARDAAKLKPLLKKADIIIPLAALVGAPLCDNDSMAAKTTNFGAVKLITDNASADQRIIYPTTNSGYGIGARDKFCTEKTALNPISLYGVVKVDAEKTVMRRANSVSLRLATVFGMSSRMRLDLLVNDFVYRAVNDRFIVVFEGHFKRNYIHILDVSKAFLHAVRNFEKMRGQSYNVGLSDANLSKIELCEKIRKHLPKFVFLESPVGEDVDKRDYIVSNEKIEKTGFKPGQSLDDGIEELMKGYRIIRNSKYGNI